MSPRGRRFDWMIVMLSLGLVLSACGDDGSTTAADTTIDDTAEGSDTSGGSATSANGLAVTAVDTGAGVVTITNNGSADLDLSGHQLCNRPNYVAVPEETLAPGESIDVTLGGLAAGGGEAALYTSADFGSSDAMISYVTWGSGGGRLSVAESGGHWSGDPVAEPADGSLTLTGDAGSASGWSG